MSPTVGRNREQMRMHDEAPRRSSDVIEWIAGDERKHGARCDIENLDLFRIYDFGGVDPVAISACSPDDLDLHARANPPQGAEKGVAMTGNADGAKATGEGRSRHVARAAQKTIPGNACHDGHGESDLGDLDAPDDASRVVRGTVPWNDLLLRVL